MNATHPPPVRPIPAPTIDLGGIAPDARTIGPRKRLRYEPTLLPQVCIDTPS
jgi:hypothetical protein